jgi:hypothetical protein
MGQVNGRGRRQHGYILLVYSIQLAGPRKPETYRLYQPRASQIRRPRLSVVKILVSWGLTRHLIRPPYIRDILVVGRTGTIHCFTNTNWLACNRTKTASLRTSLEVASQGHTARYSSRPVRFVWPVIRRYIDGVRTDMADHKGSASSGCHADFNYG